MMINSNISNENLSLPSIQSSNIPPPNPKINLWKYLSFALIFFLLACLSYIFYEKYTLAQRSNNKADNNIAVPIHTPTPTLFIKTTSVPSNFPIHPSATPTITVTVIPTGISQWQIYKDLDYKFQIEYPVGWLFATHKVNNNLDKYGEFEDKDVVILGEDEITKTIVYQLGSVQITEVDVTNELDVEAWYDKRFKANPSAPVVEYLPSKMKVFTNNRKIKILESLSPMGGTTYFFILNKKVLGSLVNYTYDGDTPQNLARRTIYKHMFDSLSSLN